MKRAIVSNIYGGSKGIGYIDEESKTILSHADFTGLDEHKCTTIKTKFELMLHEIGIIFIEEMRKYLNSTTPEFMTDVFEDVIYNPSGILTYVIDDNKTVVSKLCMGHFFYYSI